MLGVHHLTGRNSGPYRFVEAHVVLDVHDLEQAHQISYRLEEAVHEVAPNVDRVLIHFEPEHNETYVYARPSPEVTASPGVWEAEATLVTVGSEDSAWPMRYLRNP